VNKIRKKLPNQNPQNQENDFLAEVARVIRPGEKLDLIIRSSDDTEDLTSRSSTLYDLVSSSGRIIVAQTSPPMPKSMIGKIIEVSFLARNPEFEHQRFGFRAVASNILANYPLCGGNNGDVIELEYLAEAYERNLRYYFRVQPVLEQPIDLTALCDKEQFNVIDISAGGLCFSGKGLSMLKDIKIGQKLNLSVDIIAQRKMQLETMVVRKFYRDYFEYVGVKFLNMARRDKQVLLSTINRIQRISLRKRSGLYYT
jgi:hypothetical protein